MNKTGTALGTQTITQNLGKCVKGGIIEAAGRARSSPRERMKTWRVR